MFKSLLYYLVDTYYPKEIPAIDLKALYKDNTQEFESFFLEDFIGTIPKDVREPSIRFLSGGKEVLERWGMFMAYVIQSKIQSEPEKIANRQGMLTMLKLIMVHVKQGNITQKQMSEEDVEKGGSVKKDPIKEAEEAIEGLYTLQKKKNIV